MNVMAQAHKEAKEVKAARPNLPYALLLRLALVHTHKVAKAKPTTGNVLLNSLVARVARLKAMPYAKGYVVMVDDMAIDTNTSKVCNIENAPIHSTYDDAAKLAHTTRNDAGQWGHVAPISAVVGRTIRKLENMIIVVRQYA